MDIFFMLTFFAGILFFIVMCLIAFIRLLTRKGSKKFWKLAGVGIVVSIVSFVCFGITQPEKNKEENVVESAIEENIHIDDADTKQSNVSKDEDLKKKDTSSDKKVETETKPLKEESAETVSEIETVDFDEMAIQELFEKYYKKGYFISAVQENGDIKVSVKFKFKKMLLTNGAIEKQVDEIKSAAWCALKATNQYITENKIEYRGVVISAVYPDGSKPMFDDNDYSNDTELEFGIPSGTTTNRDGKEIGMETIDFNNNDMSQMAKKSQFYSWNHLTSYADSDK